MPAPSLSVQIWVLFPMTQQTENPNPYGYCSSLLWFLLDEQFSSNEEYAEFCLAAQGWINAASFPVQPWFPSPDFTPLLNIYPTLIDLPPAQTPWGIFSGPSGDYMPARTCVILRRFTSNIPPFQQGRMFWPLPAKAFTQSNILNNTGLLNFATLAVNLAQPFSWGTGNTATPALPSYRDSTLTPISNYMVSGRLGQYRKKLYDKHMGMAPLIGPKAL